ncbi:ribonuclease domain-containing protein [Andreprevotia chitinilytica]|uniref:ribonuclease domain-containing protein n=1 Tax=Andreprevotia chitinilytica TaxID=396808 RepID=UPI0005544209|nr:ribonuclease domain-containing protein [Andreprevotia chitinilytica]
MRRLLILLALLTSAANAANCRDTASDIARKTGVNANELTSALVSINNTGRLPDQFVTKRQARDAGWQPGRDLWRVLPNHSIGGDRFGNREHQLPPGGQYREADLDYRGGKRGAKRLIFDPRGRRFITVDHYQTFTEVPQCQN